MPERLSILFVSRHYPPAPGGSEQHTQRLARSLAGRGHRVLVLTGRRPGAPTLQRRSGEAAVVRFWMPAAGRRGDLCFALWILAATLVLRPFFRIIHWNMGGLHCCWGMPLAARLGFSNVFLVPGCGYARGLAGRPRGRKLIAALLRHARRVVILNSAMEEELLSLGFGRDRLVSLPCEADPDVFRPPTPAERGLLRAQWGIPEAARLVVFTGRLIETKRVPDLMRAMAARRRGDPLAFLLIAGDGDQSADLRALAEHLGLGDAARFAGQLPTAGVAQALQAADLLVLPSESEGIPCSVVEALGVGLPVVVTDIPGTELVVRGVHGLRVPVGDVPALESAIAALLAHPEDRRRMGEAGRRLFLERYTTQAVAQGYEEVYRLAASQPG